MLKNNSMSSSLAKVLTTIQRHYVGFAVALWLFELIFNVVIINVVKYTEIDWVAYMEEVGGVLQGERDYSQLKGCTGPLVYPGGFVWIYSVLHYFTQGGADIFLAQIIFVGLYQIMLAIIFAIYYKTKSTPAWLLVLVCMSKRIHSIFSLRLFNDCWAMLFVYIAVYLMASRKWTLATIFFSLGVSVKMNALLYLPAFALVLAKAEGIPRNIPRALLFLVIQVAAGWPFLVHDSWAYLKGSFDLGRVFLYEWTVNWKFISEETFVSKELAMSLLGVHVVLLLVFLVAKWTSKDSSIASLCSPLFPRHTKALDSDHIVTLLWQCNFIGILVARSLHFQFYVWYFHTLPYLLWHTRYPTIIRLAIFFAIEVVWNVFPARGWTSLLLLTCHLAILVGFFVSPVPLPYTQKKKKHR